MKACILVRTEKAQQGRVADGIKDCKIKGVEAAIPVFGPTDVVVRARVDGWKGLDELVSRIETEIDGVRRTEALPELEVTK